MIAIAAWQRPPRRLPGFETIPGRLHRAPVCDSLHRLSISQIFTLRQPPELPNHDSSAIFRQSPLAHKSESSGREIKPDTVPKGPLPVRLPPAVIIAIADVPRHPVDRSRTS